MAIKRKRIIPKHSQHPKTFVIVAFSLLALYVVYEIASNFSIPDFFSRCPDEKFVRALTKRASHDRYIVLALVDSSFTDMAMNLYRLSFQPNAIDNFLFIGASKESCEILQNQSLPCYHYAEDKAASVASTYMSPDFIRKMNIRTEMILDAIAVGFTVLHTDLDVAFFKNPLPEIKVIMGENDMAALWDSVAYNAGFIIIKPTWYSKKIYEQMKSITDYSSRTDDQTALNAAISKMLRSYKEFKISRLNPEKYLCGLDYFEKGKRLFPNKCPKCVVVHNNWIVSKEAKVYRFKEHMMWMYDKNGYYSNASSNYITYSNPIAWPSQKINDLEELEALKGALALSTMLNRKLILPRFHCASAPVKPQRRTALYERMLSKNNQPIAGQALKFNVHECPLNSLLNVSAFDKFFGDKYRENSFLRHPLVPDEVRQNKSKEIVIITLVNAGLFEQKILPTSTSEESKTNITSSENVELIDMTSKQIVDEQDVKTALNSFTEKVLVFRSLYRLSPMFSDQAKQLSFQESVKKAFRRATYQQL